jgi:REP element-mobilizing transposase RayT
MGYPRKKYVKDEQEGVYHCFSRCVRRAFLFGVDTATLRDYSHRKALIVDRLQFLTTIFAIEVCAYAILTNHYHLILRLLPHLAAAWSDRDVAIRWLTLFPHRDPLTKTLSPPTELQIASLVSRPERIEQLRKRLCSISWFMGRLNEFVARAANKEEDITGRFWESRFKCQTLLDQTAITACMVYVDLNPIRAGLAASPEQSDFTSIQERIRAWQNDPSDPVSPASTPTDSSDANSSWLCPIQSESGCRGILQITAVEYFDLVDRTGRILRADKRGAIDADLAPILLRIGANPEAWVDTISRFDSRFRLAAGLLSSLRSFAHQIGSRWLTGVSAARVAFVDNPQSA